MVVNDFCSSCEKTRLRKDSVGGKCYKCNRKAQQPKMCRRCNKKKLISTSKGIYCKNCRRTLNRLSQKKCILCETPLRKVNNSGFCKYCREEASKILHKDNVSLIRRNSEGLELRIFIKK